MHINRRSQLTWILITFSVLIGMSCSMFSSRTGNSKVEDNQSTPPPMPTTEGVTQDNLPLPLTPDAANYSSSQESFSYTTHLAPEEVAKFYREKLPPLGWTIDEQGNAGGMLLWSVSRQGVTYFLSIMPSNGMTIVNAAQLK